MTITVSGSTESTQRVESAGPWQTILWVLWFVLLVAGLYGIFQRLAYGHELAGYGSYVPWGLWIGLYFLGVGISGGSFVIGALGYILAWPGFSKPQELRTAIVLSIASIIPAFFGVALDLGRMERLFSILASPTFTSMMAFNAWMYNIFMLVAVITWLLSFSGKSVWLKPLLILGTCMSILFPSQSGVFFEAVRTNAFWHSPILSVLFLASAIALGGAALLLVKNLHGPASSTHEGSEEHYGAINRLRVVTVLGIAVYAMFEFAEFSIAFWNPGSHSPNIIFLLFGDYWPVFWILHVLLGVIIPLLFFLSSSRSLWALGCFLAIVGFAAARMSILVPGQIAGQIPGLAAAFQDMRLVYNYHPTPMEYFVACFMLAVGMTVFFVGSRLNQAVENRSKTGLEV
jgi:protein NrfD